MRRPTPLFRFYRYRFYRLARTWRSLVLPHTPLGVREDGVCVESRLLAEARPWSIRRW